MSNFTGQGWTNDEIALLTQLWCIEGLSGSQIELRMPGRSRSAIVARANRTGLSHDIRAENTRSQQRIRRPKVERQAPVRQGMIRFGNVAIPKSVIPEKPLAPERPVANPVTLADRRDDQCGWPVNDGNPFLYCGAAKNGHKRYCEHHAGVGVGRGRAA